MGHVCFVKEILTAVNLCFCEDLGRQIFQLEEVQVEERQREKCFISCSGNKSNIQLFSSYEKESKTFLLRGWTLLRKKIQRNLGSKFMSSTR